MFGVTNSVKSATVRKVWKPQNTTHTYFKSLYGVMFGVTNSVKFVTVRKVGATKYDTHIQRRCTE